MSISKQQFIQIIQTFFQKYIEAIKKKSKEKINKVKVWSL